MFRSRAQSASSRRCPLKSIHVAYFSRQVKVIFACPRLRLQDGQDETKFSIRLSAGLAKERPRLHSHRRANKGSVRLACCSGTAPLRTPAARWPCPRPVNAGYADSRADHEQQPHFAQHQAGAPSRGGRHAIAHMPVMESARGRDFAARWIASRRTLPEFGRARHQTRQSPRLRAPALRVPRWF